MLSAPALLPALQGPPMEARPELAPQQKEFLLPPHAPSQPRSPQDTFLWRSSGSKRGWPCFLAGLNQQKPLPLLAAAVLAAGRGPSLGIDGLRVRNYTLGAHRIFINEGFHPFICTSI